MKKTVLFYNINDPLRMLMIRQALDPLGITIRMVEKSEFGRPIGELAAGAEPWEPGEAPEGTDFDEEMAVLAGFSQEQIRAFMDAFKMKGLAPILCKAALTEYNASWNSRMLLSELQKEHAEIQKKIREMRGE